MPCVKDCCRPANVDVSFEILQRNAAITGGGCAAPYANRCLPGIDPDRPVTYRLVSFAAPREYGPEEGWQTVRYKKKGRKARKWRTRVEEEEEEEEA
jgi:hypothetical protein